MTRSMTDTQPEHDQDTTQTLRHHLKPRDRGPWIRRRPAPYTKSVQPQADTLGRRCPCRRLRIRWCPAPYIVYNRSNYNLKLSLVRKKSTFERRTGSTPGLPGLGWVAGSPCYSADSLVSADFATVTHLHRKIKQQHQ